MKKFFVLIGIAIIYLLLAGCGVVRDAITDAVSDVLEELANETVETDEPDDTPWHPLPDVVPAPQPKPAPEVAAPQPGGLIDIDLLGRWEFVSGTFVFYFASHGDIEFFDDNRVLEHAFGEPGVFKVLPDGQLSVIGEWNLDDTFYFDFDIYGDTLMITDHSGDSGIWRRAGLWVPTGDPENLIGRWEFVSGVAIWYFASHGDIEFFRDGRVMEHAWGEPGVFEIVADNRMSVLGEWSPRTFYFDFEISGTLLAITDHDGDRAVWRRVAHGNIPEDAI